MKTEGAYRPTIGLEVHAELKTATKMFCRCKNDPDEKEANTNICPVCMAHPGTLPVVNKEAVKHVLKIGIAVGGTLADFTEFDRKNYFYPDIPKGYQISQYQYPLVQGGNLHNVSLTRVHLEEDTARSQHKDDYSLIDFNRAGVPLMELVTEPVIHTAAEAGDFARKLQLLLRTLGAGEANMEKGQMRIEANVSVGKGDERGTKVEVKNLNSFRSVERAIEFEINRQRVLLERGEKVLQETRGWDEGKQQTFSQRLKEESHDYRYFPDPDLPKLYRSEIPEFLPEALKQDMAELPWEKQARYQRDFGIKESDAQLLTSDMLMAEFFERTASHLVQKESVQRASNYLLSDVRGHLAQRGIELTMLPMTAEAFAGLIVLLDESKISSRGAKEILEVMIEGGGDPARIAAEKNLLQTSDPSALSQIAADIIRANPGVVSEYKAGKETALQYLVGQGMRASKGSANPVLLRDLLARMLT